MQQPNFYRQLPLVKKLEDVFTSKNHQPVPSDWFVAITDVVSSTKAIEAGRYKDVNTAGGLAAMAITNVLGDMEFPFIFGGDGLTALIPAHQAVVVHDVLWDTAQKVKSFFDLDLRVGLIPISILYAQGFKIEVAKLNVSDYYQQAIISGDGLLIADNWLKDDTPNNPYRIVTPHNPAIEADFTGFTCRWQDIPSAQGETIATIIQVRDQKIANRLFPKILLRLQKIFGSETQYHPIRADLMSISHEEKNLGVEAAVFAKAKKGLAYQLRLLQYRIESVITTLALRINLPIKVGWYDLPDLRQYQVVSSDYQKFDGSFKIVLSGSTEARKRWEEFLESCFQSGEIYYGIHIADRALMTCILHADSTKEVHFIDAADGGYALAAKRMKAQMGR